MPKLAAAAQRKPVEEKITINIGAVDLGRIDLLVREGFYANRSDCIRAAIRLELSRHDDVLRDAASREQLVIGMRRVERAELEALAAAGERIDLRVLGLLEFAADIDAPLLSTTIASLTVLGTVIAPVPLRDVLKQLGA